MSSSVMWRCSRQSLINWRSKAESADGVIMLSEVESEEQKGVMLTAITVTCSHELDDPAVRIRLPNGECRCVKLKKQDAASGFKWQAPISTELAKLKELLPDGVNTHIIRVGYKPKTGERAYAMLWLMFDLATVPA